MTHSTQHPLYPWNIEGFRRTGALLVHGPLQSEAVAVRLAEDWRNVNRRIKRLHTLRALDLGPGVERARLVSLAKGEDHRIRDALETFGRARAPHKPGLVASGQTVVVVRVAPDLVGAFSEALERQLAAASVLWAARVHGRMADYVLVYDDGDGPTSDRVMEALRATGAHCESLAVSFVLDSDDLGRQLLRQREARRAIERG